MSSGLPRVVSLYRIFESFGQATEIDDGGTVAILLLMLQNRIAALSVSSTAVLVGHSVGLIGNWAY